MGDPNLSDARDELTEIAFAARDGDRIALGVFIRRTQHDVATFARHLVGPNDVDDVVQDTYVRAWRALPAFRGDASARTWLYTIARRACADHVRGAQRRRRLGARLRGASATPPDPTEAVALDALVMALDPKRREAFVATQIAGLEYAEAAVVCGVPIGTIRSRVARAREDLIRAIEAGEARPETA